MRLRERLRRLPEERHHLFFIASMVLLVVLGVWWSILLKRNVEEIYSLSIDRLVAETHLAASEIQRSGSPALPNGSDLEIVTKEQSTPGDLAVSLAPLLPDLVVRPVAGTIAVVEQARRMNVFQIVGEASLLMILILISILMLYNMVLVEGRVRRSIENFLSNVTHELKSPIAGMKSLLQTLAARSIPDDKRVQYVEMGLREAVRLQHLVENVLVANRLDRRRLQIVLQPVDVLGLLERVVETRTQLSGSASSIGMECPPSVAASADPEALSIIIENLLDNAIKYSPEGAKIAMSVNTGAAGVTISVRDDGIGIEKEEMEHIFERFYRATQNGVKAIKGSGLGLHIARTLARAMGGDVTARSAGRGQGSTFTISLRRSE